MSAGHTHRHAPANVNAAFGIGIALNLAFVAVEAFYGWKVGSLALLADAGHNLSDVAGLVLWASYPASSLADRSGLAVMSISGSQDGLSTPATIQAARTLLPSTTTYVVVDGAVHAYFGDYGPQPGDGTPTVAREPAQARIVEATVVLLDAIS